MTIWIIIIALSVCASVIMVWPLMTRRRISEQNSEAYDIAVYKDQLSELELELERNLISEVEAEHTRYEIHKRILAASEGTHAKSTSSSKLPGLVVWVLVILIPISGVALYLEFGSPRIEDYPLAERTDIQPVQMSGDSNQSDMPNMDEVLDRLQERLEQTPDDVKGWSLLARAMMSSQRYDEATNAYKKKYDLTGQINDKADYAEALLMIGDGTITPEIMEIFQEVLQANPLDARSRFYIGMADIQNNNVTSALQIWTDLLYISADDAPWVEAVKAQIDISAGEAGIDLGALVASQEIRDLAKQASIEPAQSDHARQKALEEQDEMIRSMVEGLASRLRDDPNDPEGWKRLIQSYTVLGEDEKADHARTMLEKYSK